MTISNGQGLSVPPKGQRDSPTSWSQSFRLVSATAASVQLLRGKLPLPLARQRCSPRDSGLESACPCGLDLHASFLTPSALNKPKVPS